MIGATDLLLMLAITASLLYYFYRLFKKNSKYLYNYV